MIQNLYNYHLRGTTDGSGDLTIYGKNATTEAASPQIDNALIFAVEWIDGDLADGVDAVLSVVNTPSGVDHTLLTLTNANDDAWYYPRDATHDNTGTVNTGLEYPILQGKLKLVISSGGATKTGGCIVYFWNP
jgi:hypothetical protein